jgi:uncharacterized lipoprotein YbaY/heat shock protein HslJ
MSKPPADPNLPEGNDPQDDSSYGTNGWLRGMIILLIIFLVAVIAYADLSATRFLTPPDPTQTEAFITINEPVAGSLLDLTWAVPVKGEAGGLFEGNVIVQALSASGELLDQEVTIIDSPEAGTGSSGPWSVDLQIDTPPGTQGQIIAFSTSPLDGSKVAEDHVNVGFGESPGTGELVKPENHLWSLGELVGRMLIAGTRITLQFENFQAFGFAGCNTYQTSYERRSSNLNFGIVTSTARECEEPAGILVQESAYFRALEKVVSYTVENQQLNLFDNSGGLFLVFDAVVTGEVINAPGADIPAEAVIYVQLQNVSLADAEAGSIAEQVITGITGFPFPYEVKYNPREIVANHSYAIGVRVEDPDGNLLFINPSAYHVITAGNPSQVDVTVEAVR